MEFRRIEGNEFSRLLPAEQLGLLPLDLEISADAAERSALARRFGLLDLAALTARLGVTDGAQRGLVLVQGRLEASVTQACVVTLEPVESRLQEDFAAVFADPAAMKKAAEAADAPVEEMADLPEALPAEGLDLGELVAQQLAVALDPYPHAEAAESALRAIAAVQDEGTRPSPFDVLRGLRGKD